MTTTALDPADVRCQLEVARQNGATWEEAWAPIAKYKQGDLSFMRKHFEAAYKRDDSPRGRCRVAALDTFAFEFRNLEPAPHPDPERCQSGDGCDHLATHGRFRPTFCEHHAAELARLAVRLAGPSAKGYTIHGTERARAA